MGTFGKSNHFWVQKIGTSGTRTNKFCTFPLLESSVQVSFIVVMEEKLNFKWNDFEANVMSSFRELRDDQDSTNVTLAIAVTTAINIEGGGGEVSLLLWGNRPLLTFP